MKNEAPNFREVDGPSCANCKHYGEDDGFEADRCLKYEVDFSRAALDEPSTVICDDWKEKR